MGRGLRPAGQGRSSSTGNSSSPPAKAAATARWEPPIDVFETERQLRIIVALPGVVPEAVQVQTEGGILTIVGSRAMPSCGENTKIVRLEIPYGSFERRIALQLNRLRLDQRELVNGCLVLTFVSLAEQVQFMNDTTQTSATEQAAILRAQAARSRFDHPADAQRRALSRRGGAARSRPPAIHRRGPGRRARRQADRRGAAEGRLDRHAGA